MSENIMRIIDLRGKNLSRAELLAAMPRAAMGTSEATDLVRPILDDVKERGAAPCETSRRSSIMCVPEHLRVPVEAMTAALETLDPEVRAAIEESVRRARAVAANQVPKDFYTDLAEGARVAERWIPIQRVGLYVPGGKAVYPSSVIMNAVPAQAAGVESLAIATSARTRQRGRTAQQDHPRHLRHPRRRRGLRGRWRPGHRHVRIRSQGLRAAGRRRAVRPGRQDHRPGNIFVATAKSLVSAFVGIDAVAGPTEIGIIADKTADPSLLAADLIGQAEHDELAGSVLFTDSTEIAEKVQESLNYRVPRTEHAERVHTSLSGSQSAIVLTDSLDQSIDAANAYAAEHLKSRLPTRTPSCRASRTRAPSSAASYSPVPLGDYMSGSNHVLPTGGTARFAAGLGVHTFMKPVEVIEYDEEA